MLERLPYKRLVAGSSPARTSIKENVMQHCDQTCYWCATHFWLFVKQRMKASERHAGRSGEGSFALAAATSNVPPRT
jgi:hypothetical protein